MLCLLCNTTQAVDNNKVHSEGNRRMGCNFFKNSRLFVILQTKPDNNCYFILPKKSVKWTVCRQPRKTLLRFNTNGFHPLDVKFGELNEEDILWHYLDTKSVTHMHRIFMYNNLLRENQHLKRQNKNINPVENEVEKQPCAQETNPN